MAVKQSTLKAISKETKKPVTVDDLINQAAGNFYTVEHLKKSATRLHDLSVMLDESKESPELMTNGAGFLIDFYTNEIERCIEYFAQIVEKGDVLKDQREKGGAQ